MRYEFRCRNCRHLEIYERPINERDNRTNCPVCGEEMNRIFSPVNVIYRGSGFTSTDKHLTPVDPLDYDANVHTPDDMDT